MLQLSGSDDRRDSGAFLLENVAKRRNPDRKYTGPPGFWGFGVGLTIQPSKSCVVTETRTKHLTKHITTALKEGVHLGNV